MSTLAFPPFFVMYALPKRQCEHHFIPILNLAFVFPPVIEDSSLIFFCVRILTNTFL